MAEREPPFDPHPVRREITSHLGKALANRVAPKSRQTATERTIARRVDQHPGGVNGSAQPTTLDHRQRISIAAPDVEHRITGLSGIEQKIAASDVGRGEFGHSFCSVIIDAQ